MNTQRPSSSGSDSESPDRADSHLTRTVPVASTFPASADASRAEGDTASAAGTASPARSRSSHSSSSNVIIAIAAVLAVIMAFAAGIFVGRSTAPAPGAAQGSEASQSDGNAEAAAQQPEYAPSQTDPQILKMLADEPRRDPDDPMARGKVDAPVVMVEYSDYSCPMCAKYAQDVEPELQGLIDEGTLRIEYRDMVIFPDKGSDIAAAAARAAGLQGKFIEFHEALYAQAPTRDHAVYTQDSVTQIATQVGVEDLDKFRADLTSDQIRQAIAADTKHGQSVGLTGTPSFFINNAYLTGVYQPDFLIRTIENQASEAGQAIEPSSQDQATK